MADQRLRRLWPGHRRGEDPPPQGTAPDRPPPLAAPVPPVPPAPPVPSVPEDRGRTLRLAGWLTVIFLAVMVAAYTVWAAGPPTKAELYEQARLVGKQKLLIGVKDDTPGIAWRNPKTGRYEGFDIDIAYMVAAELGFRPDQVEFLAIETEDRGRMQARDESGKFVTVDLVVATYSITPERQAQTTMSQAYLETEQTVVTRVGHPPVTSLNDLAGKKVCTLGTSTSENAAARAGAVLVGKNRISECIAGLKNKEFDAVTTDAAILAGFVAAEPDVLQVHDIGLATPERWGISTGRNRALGVLVDLALYRSYADPADRRWEEAFAKHLAPLQPANGRQQVAVSEQPWTVEPEVRRWPWERGGF